MKQQLIIHILLFTILNSCQNNKDRIQGSWIEKNNFENPTTLDFEELSFKMTTNNQKSEKLYHIKNDTLYVGGVDQVYKSIIKLEGDKLEIYNIDSVTPANIFERYIYEDIVSYFNSKKRTSIELPRLELKFQGADKNYNNTLFADNVDGELVIYFNGVLHELNDTSYLALTKNHWEEKCQLFIDNGLTISSLNKIKTELRKAQLNSIGYAVYDKNDSIINIGLLLPPIESPGDSPLSPSPQKELNKNKTKNIVVEIYQDSLSLDGKMINKENLKLDLKELIKLDDNEIICVYYDEQLKYERFINFITIIQSAYIELREEYALDNFQISNYTKLDYEDKNRIRKRYPMHIREIETN